MPSVEHVPVCNSNTYNLKLQLYRYGQLSAQFDSPSPLPYYRGSCRFLFCESPIAKEICDSPNQPSALAVLPFAIIIGGVVTIGGLIISGGVIIISVLTTIGGLIISGGLIIISGLTAIGGLILRMCSSSQTRP